MKLKSFSLVLFLIFVIGCSSSKTNDDSYQLNINYSFSGLKDGYDHLNKIIIYFDGIPAGTSSKKYESEPNSVSVEAYPGKIHVKIENIVYYNGAWEVHSKENGYNADCIYQADMVFDKDRKIDLLFDLANGAQLLSND